jgi:RNA-directed DNA polymerase
MINEEETRSIPITKRMVWNAWKKVKANQGSAGVDKIGLEEFHADLSANLYKLWNRLSSGSYFPLPVREVSIPKKDGSIRKLGIPTIADRIAQQVIKSYLEPRFEEEFHSNSYGYRPKRSAHQAVEAVRDNLRSYSWVVDMDISKFFDTMSHELLMQGLEKHVDEKWVKLYIKRWLEVSSENANGERTVKQGRGTPQGGVISPLLANLFLHYALDKWLEINYPAVSFVRYADDCVIHCNSKEEAETVLNAVRKRLLSCQLSLNEKKTKIVYCWSNRRERKDYPIKFDFLGFSFKPRSFKTKEGEIKYGYDCAISIESEKRIMEKIRASKLRRWIKATIEEIAAQFNPQLRGWINYYGKYKKHQLNRVLRRFHFHLMKWVLNKYRKFKASTKRAYEWIKTERDRNPNLFYHWKAGFRTM